MNYWDKTKFFEKLLLFTWLAFLFSCLLFLSFTSHAAADQYYFPMEQNKNSHFSGATNVIDEYFDSADNYIFVSYVSSNWGNAIDSFVICYYPKSFGVSLYGEIYTNAREFGLYKNTQRDFSFASFDIYWQYGTNPIVQSVSTITPENFFTRTFVSSSYSSNADYVSNYQIYTSNNVGSRQVVLLYSSSDNDEIEDNNTIPDDFNKPDINNYISNWSNSPSFDNSSVEAALSSVFDNITWFANNINNTITGLISYLSDSINWGLQMVINNIRSKIEEMTKAIGDKIDDVRVGIGSKIEDIQDSIDYITQPVDGDVIYDSISTTSLIGNFNTIKTSITTFQTSFENLSEPTEYKIPIHLENLNFPIFGTLTVQYIDLSVINPVKSIIRLMITALVTYSLVITIFDSISNYINGGGDE